MVDRSEEWKTLNILTLADIMASFTPAVSEADKSALLGIRRELANRDQEAAALKRFLAPTAPGLNRYTVAISRQRIRYAEVSMQVHAADEREAAGLVLKAAEKDRDLWTVDETTEDDGHTDFEVAGPRGTDSWRED